MSISDHFKKITEKKDAKQASKGSNFGDVWHNWADNDNFVRFVGDFIYTKTHYIGNITRINPLKLFDDAAFKGEIKVPQLMNCANWDIEKEEYKKEGKCIICKLNKIARDITKSKEYDGMPEDSKKEFKDLKTKTDNRSSYRWNIIDRKNPFVKEGEKGFKITAVSQELYDQLGGIHSEYAPKDFTSEADGIDIKVTRSGGDYTRTTYRAQPCLAGNSLKVTPLTEEEKTWKRHGLLEIVGKQTDQEMVFEKLLDKWKELITALSEAPKEEEKPEVKATPAPAATPAPEVKEEGKKTNPF